MFVSSSLQSEVQARSRSRRKNFQKNLFLQCFTAELQKTLDFLLLGECSWQWVSKQVDQMRLCAYLVVDIHSLIWSLVDGFGFGRLSRIVFVISNLRPCRHVWMWQLQPSMGRGRQRCLNYLRYTRYKLEYKLIKANSTTIFEHNDPSNYIWSREYKTRCTYIVHWGSSSQNRIQKWRYAKTR